MRFELTTLTLARLCSTPELRPLGTVDLGDIVFGEGYLATCFGGCKSKIVRVAKKSEHAADGIMHSEQ